MLGKLEIHPAADCSRNLKALGYRPDMTDPPFNNEPATQYIPAQRSRNEPTSTSYVSTTHTSTSSPHIPLPTVIGQQHMQHTITPRSAATSEPARATIMPLIEQSARLSTTYHDPNNHAITSLEDILTNCTEPLSGQGEGVADQRNWEEGGRCPDHEILQEMQTQVCLDPS
jgi:hypothetical protein